MPMNNSPRRRKNTGFALNNQTLMILVGVLAAVLIVLLVICGSVLNRPVANPESNALNNNSTGALQSTGQASSSIVTQPSSSVVTQPPTSIATQPPTTAPKPPVTPSGGNYENVGSGYIAEVIQVNVESFDGDTYDDYSHPTNNYLPEGTVDYCAKELVYGSGLKYVKLRSGHRVYYDKKVYPHASEPYARMVAEVKQYAGTLPDHNEIGVVSLETVGRHSVLTLDTMWKAPFYFETNQSGYANPKGGKERDYAVSSNNATYVDITFCYATEFEGSVSIPGDHPLFKSAEVIKNESDHTLRLHLRKRGSLYGWHAYYNDQDQLCFQFLNPVKVTAAENKYGADLTGTTIMIDVGHGGVDGGAVAKDAEGKTWDEAELNLLLANALKAELESVGATVVMNRYGDDRIDVNERQRDLLKKSPDICIAIHQNSTSDNTTRRFDCFYYTSWSQLLAKNIYERTKESGVYSYLKKDVLQSGTRLRWSANYFMCRQTLCPVVLTENGYMSNPEDLAAMIDPVKVEIKATAIAHGVADYFLAINK